MVCPCVGLFDFWLILLCLCCGGGGFVCNGGSVCGWRCWVALVSRKDYGLKGESQGKREDVKGEKIY